MTEADRPNRVGYPRTTLSVLGVVLGLLAGELRARHLSAVAARAAALDERRRVARDLHDGIAQDLAFIAAYGERLAGEAGEPHPLVIAARRALSISRGTIAELAGEPPTTAKTALEAVARELAARFGAAIAVEANVSRDLAPEAREQLTRIAREAVVNACRHGRARQVSLSLSTSTDATVLRVTDDGRGIAARDAVDGFGMRTMRERAGALGARLSVRERVDGGTQLEVVVP